MIGAGLGFLWFNAPPAMIFMGDTGSLSLGGALGAIAVVAKHEIVLAVIGGLFVLETVSVMVQVISFKLTGKRVLPWRRSTIISSRRGGGADHRDQVLDHRRRPGAGRLVDPQAAVTSAMFPATRFKGRRIAVLGLARSGLASAQALQAGGAEIAAWDDGEEARREAAAAGIPLRDLSQADFSAFTALVLSPGIPLTHPRPHWSVDRAHAAGIEVIGDTEIFIREIAGTGSRLVAITGTNGKSTTTALTGHVLRSAGLDAHVGGNIGTAVFQLPPPGVRPRLCPRALLLSDRPHPRAQA